MRLSLLRVQLLLASLNSLNNKSGLNKKSMINNTNFEAYSSPEQAMTSIESVDVMRKLYDIFWNNIAYLSNPFLFLESESASKTNGPKKEKVLNLLRSFLGILKYFQNNPIEEEEPVIRRFPKYIKDINLFQYQINEPYFRKTVLIQLKFLLFNIENPMEVYGKHFEPFNDVENKEIKEFDDLLSFLLVRFKPFGNKSKRNLQDIILRLLSSEKEWMKWKEDGCKAYSREMDSADIEKVRSSQAIFDSAPLENFVREKNRDIRGWLNLDVEYEHMIALSKENLSVLSQ